LQDVFDLRIHHFDTASFYGQGDSERYIGKTFTGRRKEACLVTKAGQRLTPLRVIIRKFKTLIRLLKRLCGSLRQVVGKKRAAGANFCFDPAYIDSSLSRSLQRLQINTVDIFYLHSPPLEALQDRKLMRLLERLRHEDKIGAIGMSCNDLEITRAAAGHPLVEIMQHDLVNQPLRAKSCRQPIEPVLVCLVRGIARDAAQKEGNYEENLIAGFRSALALPSVG
jgi:aryl-alcohol dehydrogenase-like predicted oxidoreductase